MKSATWALASLLAWSLPLVRAFSFTTSTPSQCQNLTLSWKGDVKGQLHFLLVPTVEIASGKILNMTVPASSDNTYNFQLTEPSGLSFLATMWDDSGLGSGGSTEVLTVGSSGDTSCLDTNVQADFFFSTTPNAAPGSCSSMRIEWGSNATRPISLVGMIPHGSVFSLPVSQDPQVNTYDWTVDIAEGTEVLLAMGDEGPFKTGGSTPLRTVGSGSSACITSSSPRVAANSSTDTIDGVGGSSAGGSVDPNTGNTGGSGSGSTPAKSTPIGAIVGGTVGGVAFLVLLAILLFLYFRRKAAARRGENGIKSYGIAETGEKRHRSPMDLISGSGKAARPSAEATSALRADEQRLPVPSEADLDGSYYPSPFQYPSPPDSPGAANQTMPLMGGVASSQSDVKHSAPHSAMSESQRQSSEADTAQGTLGHSRSTHKPRVHITNPDIQPDTSLAASSTAAAETEESRPTRIVQHTDAEEIEELPPSYHKLKGPSQQV